MVINKDNIDRFIDGEIMDCRNKSITSIEYIPEGITHLYCEHNKLTQLPNLPKSLIYLDCKHNLLTTLPHLHYTLGVIYCDYNYIPNYPDDIFLDSDWISKHNKQLKLLNRSKVIKDILNN